MSDYNFQKTSVPLDLFFRFTNSVEPYILNIKNGPHSAGHIINLRDLQSEMSVSLL